MRSKLEEKKNRIEGQIIKSVHLTLCRNDNKIPDNKMKYS